MQNVLRTLVEFEGPIEVERLLLLAHRRFDMLKVVEARRAIARNLIDSAAFRAGKQDFAWPDGLDPNDWLGYRFVTDSSERTIHETAPEEIANAMRSVLGSSSGMTSEELQREAYTALGYKRMGSRARETLEHAVQVGLRTDRFVEAGGAYRA